ncbi:MAG: DNA repair protein RecO [Planctomycetota bacterium]
MKRRTFRSGPPKTTDALFVRISAYAESSAVAHLLTSDLGAVSAVAKGAKRLSNSFQGPLDRGRLYRVRLTRRGSEGLFHLHSASVSEAFPSLRYDPDRFISASLVLEVASDLMREDEPHAALFRLTGFTLKVLERAPRERLAIVTPFFLVRALELSGHAPEFDACIISGRRVPRDRPALVHPGRGGLVHPDEGKGEPGSRSVPWHLLDLYADLRDQRPEEALRLPAARGDANALRRFLVDWLEFVLERRFRAALVGVPAAG